MFSLQSQKFLGIFPNTAKTVLVFFLTQPKVSWYFSSHSQKCLGIFPPKAKKILGIFPHTVQPKCRGIFLTQLKGLGFLPHAAKSVLVFFLPQPKVSWYFCVQKIQISPRYNYCFVQCSSI